MSAVVHASGHIEAAGMQQPATMTDFVGMLERAALRLEQDPSNECHLCNAWLPHPKALAEAAGDRGIAGAETRCNGCGATYVILTCGGWNRVLTEQDATNPYLAALYLRRYGAAPPGWCEPPPELLVRLPSERRVCAQAVSAAPVSGDGSYRP